MSSPPKSHTDRDREEPSEAVSPAAVSSLAAPEKEADSDLDTPAPTPTPAVPKESAAGILASGAVIEAVDANDNGNNNDGVGTTAGYHSDYGSDVPSDTTSVTSSVRDYVYENGRRYHRYGGEGKYILPNDETEQDRLDLMHHVLLMALGGELHMAPIKNPYNVLDCGTGTGIWALDFGDQHPEAAVTGVDLSPIQPGWVAPNVRFEVDDLEKDWTWPENTFDFIHIRSICNGIRDYQRLVNQAFRHTKPGGWTELSEISFDVHSKDGTMTEDTAIYKYMQIGTEAYRRLGIVFPGPSMMRECMENAGYVDVVAKTINIPWGPWPKNKKLRELGAYFALNGTAGFEAYGLAAITRGLGMEEAEAKKICHGAYYDILNRNIHVVGPVHYVYGRKPE
ncbi:S-adenosyl-L-methionine-dependent methyltransferase [Ascodesmis nigricans]|uniref:S-adenosyl-L-methionine-dependent methyltransferase n=1 Tax=Ascodesmis nigricans TaxID=341454 RepID=A0A4S2MIS4_9PEZI|nr:S-adenosyl-L-methionine-dependent methyltransferase [Ascodesmis nigricans]